jgi:phage terminase small subunit
LARKKKDIAFPRLNYRRQVYVKAYLQHMQGKRAAVEAGYAKGSAEDASKLLQRDPLVREAITAGLAAREQEIKDTVARAMEHTYCQATADIAGLFDESGNLLPVRDIPRKLRRAIASVEVETRGANTTVTKVKLHDKRASQELLVRFAGKLKDRIELDATKSFEQVVLEAERLRRERTKGTEKASE